jgi:nucleotide-binding universal stress UspA family protein
MFPRLLVGLDGSAGADAALGLAIALGRRFPTTLVLAAVTDVRVLEAPLYGAGPLWAEGMPVAPSVAELGTVLEERSLQLLNAAADRVRAEGLAVETVHATGVVDEELLRFLEEADALVLGRRGELHERPGTLGGVTTHLVRRSPKPVLVAGERPSALARPVVACDGGTTSAAALEVAATWAATLSIPLDVVHVGDVSSAAAVLDSAGDVLRARGVTFTTARLDGDVAGAIAAHADARQADLLFVGAHGGRHRRTLFEGSHAEKLLRATAVPVVIAR